MKKILLPLFVFFASFNGNSQNVAACQNAQNICSNPNFVFQPITGTGLTGTLNISNPTVNPQMGNGNNPTAPANSGCLLTNGPGPQWLILTVSVSGNLGFIFGDPASANPQVGFYDWAMWPFTPTTCAAIFNNSLAPVSCNWNASSSGGTGMGAVPPGGNVGNYQPTIPVTAGQQFLILISNYSSVSTLVSFTSTGTASLTCGFNSAVCMGGTANITPVGFVPLTNQSFTLQPLGLVNNTGTFVVTPSVSTTYTVIGTGLNSQSLQTTQTSTTVVSVSPQPTMTPTFTNSSCTNSLNAFNLGLSFIPASSSSTYSVVWAPIPPGITTATQVSLSGSSIPAGLYQATITAAGGCSTTASFSLNPPPEQAVINLIPLTLSHTITCSQPTVTINAQVATNNYTWTNGVSTPIYSPTANINYMGLGNWTVFAQHPISLCISTKTFAVFQNTVFPTSSLTPTLQNITCSVSSVISITATAGPTVNISHQILSPLGGTFTAQTPTITYLPGGPGTYTHCVVNDVNGCSVCKEFTVASSQGFPTYSLTSPSNFTLGCNSKSVAIININGAQTTPTPGGPISYTIIGPPTSTAIQSPTLSTLSNYSINVPGTWTVIVKDHTNLCETRVPMTILSNTFAPDISAIVEKQILDCNQPTVTLRAQSISPNVSYVWNFPGTPNIRLGDTLTVGVNTLAMTNSFVANYSLTITDNSSTCKSFSVIPIYQNIFKPNALLTNGGTNSITCSTHTITLTNLSSSSIPPGTGFPNVLPVIGYIWDGPTPQEPKQMTSTYVGAVPGVYTLTAKDLNNGCISTVTTAILDNRVFPAFKPNTAPRVLDCGSDTVKISPYITNPSTNYFYQWITVPGSTVTGVNTGTLSTNMAGQYKILITNTVNGCASSTEMSVVNGTLNAAFAVDQTEGFAPLNVVFTNNSSSNKGAADITSVWNFGNGKTLETKSASINPASVFAQAGNYTVTLYVQKGNCLDSATRIIHVELPSKLEIPNVFTPNNDGVNDVFFVKATNLPQMSILIFDKWGNKVYELNSDSGNIAWDGKNQHGKEVAEGTYFYIMTATGKDGQKFDKNGSINLFR
jgi:gliding motility-associated-like protein